MAVTTHGDGAAQPEPGVVQEPGVGRDPALDLLRALALGRVLLWHAFGATWMTYLAAIPVMFFVAGSLLAASSRHRPYGQLVIRRCRRLLPPLWVYGGFVAVASAVEGARRQPGWHLSASSLRGIASWIVPLTDPGRASWHAGWLSDHLWYLRAYLWLVLLAPVFVFLARRVVLGLVVLGAGVVLMEVSTTRAVPLLHGGTSRILIGDAVTYGLFLMLGMAYRRRDRALPRAALAAGAAASAVALAVYVAVAGLPGNNVNGSYPAIALSGCALLFAAGAAEPAIRRVAAHPRIQPASRSVNGRAETIYIWHPAAIVVAYAILDHWAPVPASVLAGRLHWLSMIAVVAIAVVGTAAAVVLVGWVEELGAGRFVPPERVRQQARRTATIAVPVAAVLALGAPLIAMSNVAGGSVAMRAGRSRIPPPPSYRDTLANSAFATTTSTSAPPPAVTTTVAPAPVVTTVPAAAPAALPAAPAPLPAAALQAALDGWRRTQPAVRSIAVGVAVGGQEWSGNAGIPTVLAAQRYPVASMTKTFTIALVLREVEAGRIELDAPVPRLAGIPDPPEGVVITTRDLLRHSSGLVDYSAATGFDEHQVLTPVNAVAMSMRTPLLGAPGTVVHYSSTNYVYLGLILEHVTGRPYSALLHDLITPLGLTATSLDTGLEAGRVGFSAGGVRSTVTDMARWTDALFTPGRVLSPASVALLTTVDDGNVGLGTWPLCPCSIDAQGHKHAVAMGQYIADGGIYHFADGLSVVLHVDPVSANSEVRIAALGTALAKAIPGAEAPDRTLAGP